MKYLRMASILLSITIIVPYLLVSCVGKNASTVQTTDMNPFESSLSELDSKTEDTTAEQFPHEDINFEGKVFRVLADEEISGNNLYYDDLNVSEENGEILNDAIYKRNLAVSERFNVILESESLSGASDIIASLVNAGDTTYDAVNLRLATAYNKSNYCMDLMSLNNLLLNKPYWDINSINNLSIGGKLKMITGDIFIKHYDAIQILLFNKQMLQNYALEDLYTLVNEKRWTLDKMSEMCKAVTTDIDGNQQMDRYDQYGFACQFNDFGYGMLNGSGLKLMYKDTNDMPNSQLDIQKMTSVFDKFYSFFDSYSFDIGRDAHYANLCAFWVFPEGAVLVLLGNAQIYQLEPARHGSGLRYNPYSTVR